MTAFDSRRALISRIILFLGLPLALFAVTYRVGPTQSYHTLQEITGLLQPGDSALVDGDTTYPGDVIFTEAGTPSLPIVIRGIRINGRRPVITGGTNTVQFESPWPCTTGADHYRFEGFEVTGGSSRGIYHQADDLTIRDVLVRDCPYHGILGADQGSGSCLMEFVEVRDCGSGSSRHQVYMATDEVNRPGSVFRMQFCYLHDARGGNNVKSRAERNEIYYNWVEGAYYHELELIGPDPNGAPPGWTPRLKREDSDVVGNVLRKRGTAYGNDSNFAVTRIGGDATGESHGRYRFVNNTIISGTGAVFRCFDSLESVEMHNNVFCRPGGGVNIMRVVEANWTQDSAVIAGSNNWVYQGALNIPSVWTGTILGTNPGFRNYPTADYRPDIGSPLINAANPAPQNPPGFPFPQPLFPPAFHPPLHAAVATAETRPVYGSLDIAAYEYTPTGILEDHNLPRKATVIVGPQPFRGKVYFRGLNAAAGPVRLELFDCGGRKIRAINKIPNPAPAADVSWDGRDDQGRKMPAGVYLFVIQTGGVRAYGSVVKSE